MIAYRPESGAPLRRSHIPQGLWELAHHREGGLLSMFLSQARAVQTDGDRGLRISGLALNKGSRPKYSDLIGH